MMAIDGLSLGWAIHIEAFEAVLAAVLPALGRPQRVVGRPLFRRLRQLGVDRAVRSWALRLMAPRTDQRGGAAVVFVSELATPSALEPAIEVGRALGRSFQGDRRTLPALALVADPRAFRAWRRTTVPAMPLLLGVGEERRILASARRAIGPAWKHHRSHLPPLVVSGRDLTTVAATALAPLVARSTPWLFVERAALERAIDRTQPGVVVVTSDQHRIGRLSCAVAAARGLPSIVLQHGLPQSTLGYLPLAADRVVAWSPSAVEWFAARGAPAERLLRAGNPRLDGLVRSDRAGTRQAVASRVGVGADLNVLAALSVAAPEVNVRLVDTAIAALRQLDGSALIVKLHPGGSDWRPVRARVTAARDLAARIRILERDSLYPLLEWADVVVMHRSTVAAEALAAGRPVVAVRYAGGSVAALEIASLDQPEVEDGAGLAAILAGWSDPSARTRFLDERRSRLEWHVGPLDGHAAERAAAIIAAASGRRASDAS
ncbi:MAG: hypothetical protein L0227_08755 [Chloroflexi bacterium]|nr:hypothetical protein [Chloroflexota bacterium]